MLRVLQLRAMLSTSAVQQALKVEELRRTLPMFFVGFFDQ